jgi:glycosyltransferase involved in cell wall biosynthesis
MREFAKIKNDFIIIMKNRNNLNVSSIFNKKNNFSELILEFEKSQNSQMKLNEDSFCQWLLSSDSDSLGAPRFYIFVSQKRPDLKKIFNPTSSSYIIAIFDWLYAHGVKESEIEVLLPKFEKFARKRKALLENNYDGVNLFGYFNKISGLGEMARRTCSAIETINFPMSLVEIPIQSQPNLDKREQINSENLALFKNNLYVFSPQEDEYVRKIIHDSFLSPKKQELIYTTWETTVFPENLRDRLAAYSCVIVPSKFIQDNLNANFNIKSVLIPIPLRQVNRYKATIQDSILIEGDYFFMAFDLLSDFERKNPLAAVHAFKTAFADKSSRQISPKLVIKILNYDDKNVKIQELLKIISGNKKIIILKKHIESQKLKAIIKNSLALVSTHRAEGYGLFLLDAMAEGTLVIATNYSGNLEFMNNSNSILLPYQLEKIDRSSYYFNKKANNLWAEIDQSYLIDVFRNIYENSQKYHKLKIESKKVKSIYSSEEIGRQWKILFDGI